MCRLPIVVTLHAIGLRGVVMLLLGALIVLRLR